MTIIHGFGSFRRPDEEEGKKEDTEQETRHGGKGENPP